MNQMRGISLKEAESWASTSTIQIDEKLEFILEPPLELTTQASLTSIEIGKKSPFSNLRLKIQRHMVKIFTEFY